MKGSLQDRITDTRVPLKETTVVGRRADCELVLNDAKISRKHAMVRWQDGGYWLYDLDSSNGCYLNGRRVTTAEKLSDLDLIRFGPFEYSFHSGESATPESHDIEDDFMATIADVRTAPVLMLVSDIKGFTKLSERISPDLLAKSMGVWYRECERVLEEHGATIDKFIGDCVLAYWLDTSADSRMSAFEAAKDLVVATRNIIDEQSDALAAHPDIQLEIGVGIHLGNAAHGSMSQGAFTLLGDAVNVTFRLESLTRKLDGGILISGECLEGWDDGREQCTPQGSHVVKGRDAPLDVFALNS